MLQEQVIYRVLTAALETGADFAEIFAEDKTSGRLEMVGGMLESSLSGRDYGVGIRVLQGNFSVYAYTNDSSEENLIDTARSAAAAIRGGAAGSRVMDLRRTVTDNRHYIGIMPDSSQKKRNIELMRRAHSTATAYDPSIAQTKIHAMNQLQNILIANTEGLLVQDIRVYTRLGISAVAEDGDQKQSGFSGPGAYAGHEFLESLDIEEHARKASRIAVTMVKAGNAPSGRLPVIIDNGFGGVLFHEACGHGLESTAVAPGSSVFAGKIGERVASPLVTAVDDGTIANAWGSLNIDDEGAKTQRNVLIENGILKGYLIDRMGSRRMGMPSTGSGRRQSYKFAPASRMNNTFISNGTSTREEIIANTEYGIYAKSMGGGSVNTATSDFNFAVQEAYIIRNGKIAEPVKGATLIGKGIDCLSKIDMVGNNLEHGQGMCGSVSGSLPVNCGQPTIRVSEMTVGGRKGE
ncbi:TldD/PmbA family protein [Paenibacillus durus]|uniref:Peptidase C69 n=3 Tax=Paenibacillus durus TaxID=44251 RepID=A0A0F7FB84_PAEDU|nr:TldD/PmbA family protein [Paenibacillus durus]AKG35465.1 peptidase C69 [Paenibacillus durus ATCC 35681]